MPALGGDHTAPLNGETGTGIDAHQGPDATPLKDAGLRIDSRVLDLALRLVGEC